MVRMGLMQAKAIWKRNRNGYPSILALLVDRHRRYGTEYTDSMYYVGKTDMPEESLASITLID